MIHLKINLYLNIEIFEIYVELDKYFLLNHSKDHTRYSCVYYVLVKNI